MSTPDKEPIPEELKQRIDQIAEEVCPHEGYGVTRKECEKSSHWLDFMEGARCGAFVMYNQQQADLLAARNKNNDDGIEIARLLAELKRCQENLTALIDEALQKSKRLDEVGKALIELMADVRNKPNDTRYATHMKRAQAVLDKYPSPAPTNKDK